MNAALHVATILFMPLVVGAAVVRLAWGRTGDVRETVFSRIPVSIGIGLGLTACTTFLSLVVFGRPGILFEGTLAALCWAAVWRRGGRPARPLGTRTEGSLGVGWGLALALVLAAATFAILADFARNTHGHWDAWSFWNMRARFFVRAGPDWWRSFTRHLPWTHPSYPPLFPSAVARGFWLVGAELPIVPRTIAVAFAVATLAVLYDSLRRLRGSTQAVLGVLTLAATPFFVFHAASLYADVPLGFFFLTAAVSFARSDASGGAGGPLALAGVSLGFAILTKNEGLVFCASALAARGLARLPQGRGAILTDGRAIACGLAPFAALFAFFQARWAARPPSWGPFAEFYTGPWTGLFAQIGQRLGDDARAVEIARAWGRHLFSFDGFPIPLAAVLALYGASGGLEPSRARTTERTVVTTLALHAAGISAVFFFLSLMDVAPHMHALDRLLCQILPTALFGFFAAVRDPDWARLPMPQALASGLRRASSLPTESWRKLLPRARRLLPFAIGGALVVVLGTLGALRVTRPEAGRPPLRARASASERPEPSRTFGPENAIDRRLDTEWILPYQTLGFLEVRLEPPRDLRVVRLRNACYPGAYDRATRGYRLEAWKGGRRVASVDAAFPRYERRPAWIEVALRARAVTLVRFEVSSYFGAGGGLAEIQIPR